MAAAEQQERHGASSVIDWEVAASVARRLVGTGPDVPVDVAVVVVRRLRSLAATAEGHVRELTGLGAGLPIHPGEVVDRAGWVQAATDGLAALTSASLDPTITPSRIAAGAAGVQAGLALGYLGSRVLGQYDPFGGVTGRAGSEHSGRQPGGYGPGRLLLVAPNVVAVQRALDVPAEDFRMWVCLHEATHRLQFTGVPWLRDHFADLVTTFLSTMDTTASRLVERLPDALRAARRGPASSADGGLIAYLQAPRQREAMHKLLALATLLEGHADYVMDAVGPQVVPSVVTIRTLFSARRRGGGVLDRLLRALLGVDAKVRQYAKGSAFTRQVIDAAGMGGFNAVWTSPQTLPTRGEIDQPGEWLRRVRP